MKFVHFLTTLLSSSSFCLSIFVCVGFDLLSAQFHFLAHFLAFIHFLPTLLSSPNFYSSILSGRRSIFYPLSSLCPLSAHIFVCLFSAYCLLFDYCFVLCTHSVTFFSSILCSINCLYPHSIHFIVFVHFLPGHFFYMSSDLFSAYFLVIVRFLTPTSSLFILFTGLFFLSRNSFHFLLPFLYSSMLYLDIFASLNKAWSFSYPCLHSAHKFLRISFNLFSVHILCPLFAWSFWLCQPQFIFCPSSLSTFLSDMLFVSALVYFLSTSSPDILPALVYVLPISCFCSFSCYRSIFAQTVSFLYLLPLKFVIK